MILFWKVSCYRNDNVAWPNPLFLGGGEGGKRRGKEGCLFLVQR